MIPADENEGSIDEGGSRCTQRRLLRQEYRRPEGGSYIQNCDFIEVAHVLFKFTTADENDLSTLERSIENSPALQRWEDKHKWEQVP